MSTIDLSTPGPTPEGTLEGLPRRLALTLPELRLMAEHAGNAPLPFEPEDPASAGGSALENRLGQSRAGIESSAYAAALETLHDPAESLARRALLVDGSADAGVIGALGLLASPQLAVDIDVTVDRARARAWHRQRGDAMASLATADGLVFELAWFESARWPDELARVGVLPEDLTLGHSQVPAHLDLPYEVVDAGAEAVRAGRGDLLATIVGRNAGAARDANGRPVDDATTTAAITALVGETQGRLRAMAADVTDGGQVVGVVSWTLVADGWRSIRPYVADETNRVEIRSVEPGDLAAGLAPVLAEVSS